MTCVFQLQGNIEKGIFDVIDDGLMVVNRALASLHGGLLNITLIVSLRGLFNYFKIRKYT